MRDQATGLRLEPQALEVGPDPRGRFVAVLSGKGGVGKTNLVANLAVAAAGLRARVLVVDGDLGLSNLDVLLGLVAPHTVEDVLLGRRSVAETLVQGPRGVHLLPAASGRGDLAALADAHLERLVRLLREVALDYDLVLVDAGPGVGPNAIGLASRCARALIVTTREPTSLADAYAALKLLVQRAPRLPIELVVNGVGDAVQARATHARLDRMARRFLDTSIGLRGFLSQDARLAEAVARQCAVVELYPTATSSRQLVALAQELLRDHRSPERDRRPAPEAPGTGAPTCTRS
jgi:flagellar biosynthesis protein FlhG